MKEDEPRKVNRLTYFVAGVLGIGGVLLSACDDSDQKDSARATTTLTPAPVETILPSSPSIVEPSPETTEAAGNMTLVLDGRGDGVRIEDSESLHLRGPITIEARVKVKQHEGVEVVTEFGSDAVLSKGEATEAYGLYANLVGCFQKAGAFLLDRSFCSDVEVQKGVSNNLAVVYDGQKVTFYLNGQEVGIQPWTGDLILNSDPLFIGQSPFGISNEDFSGEVNWVALWNTARTKEQVDSDFETAIVFVPEAENEGLVGLWRFNGNFSDSTSNQNHGTSLDDAHLDSVED